MNRLSGMWLLQIVILMFYVTSISCIVQEASNLNSTHSTTIPRLRMAKKKHLGELQNEGYNIVKRLAREFTSNYFKRFVNDVRATSIVSPIANFIIISMLSYGGFGHERIPFLSTIGLRKNESRIAKYGYKRLIDTLSNYNMKLATKIYYTRDIELTTYFTNLTQTFFNAEIESVDAREEYISNKKVNDWVKSKTNDEIGMMYSDYLHIGPNPSIVLLTTVYFKGVWESPFDPSLTTVRPFYWNSHRFGSLKVTTMHKYARMPYGRIESIRANFVELAYKTDGTHDPMSMFIILPDIGVHYSEVSMNWTKVNWDELNNTTMRYVDLHLPKIKFEYDGFVRPPSDYGYPYHGGPHMNIHSTFERMIIPSQTMSVGVCSVKYVIDINEGGDTASGSSGLFYTKPRFLRFPRNAPQTQVEKPVDFDVNYPYFVIIATKGQIFQELFIMQNIGWPSSAFNQANFRV